MCAHSWARNIHSRSWMSAHECSTCWAFMNEKGRINYPINNSVAVSWQSGNCGVLLILFFRGSIPLDASQTLLISSTFMLALSFAWMSRECDNEEEISNVEWELMSMRECNNKREY